MLSCTKYAFFFKILYRKQGLFSKIVLAVGIEIPMGYGGISLIGTKCLMKILCCTMVVKCQYFSLSRSHPPFPCCSLSTHLFAFATQNYSSSFQCVVCILILKNGFSKIKSLYMHWKRLSCLAAFTTLCSMSRRATQSHNHNANQTTCFEDQIAIRAKSVFGAFTCHLIHVGIIEWLMWQSSDKSNHSHFSLMWWCVSAGSAPYIYLCACVCERESMS